MIGFLIMNEEKLLPHLIEKLEKDFNLESSNLPISSGLNQIREHLIEKINEYLSGSFERFMNILYLIDVDETRVGKIFAEKENPEKISEKLADLIIERQLQRIRTQILYKEGKI